MSTISNFKKSIDLFPKNSMDLNIVFSISYAEYRGYIKVLEVLLFPSSVIKHALEQTATSLDNAMYSTIIHGINALDSTLKSVLPKPFNKNMAMDINVAGVGDLLSVACTDYFGSLPEDLFNIYQDVKHGLNKASNMLLGPGLMMAMANDLLKVKDDALKDIFGTDTFNNILSPIIDYENFLTENGIMDIIIRMQKLEKCLTKPGVGGRPKKDFIEPNSHKLYSTYFKQQFILDSKGNVSVKSLGVTAENRARMNNVMKNLHNFRLTIV